MMSYREFYDALIVALLPYFPHLHARPIVRGVE